MEDGDNFMLFHSDIEMKGLHTKAKTMTSNEGSYGAYHMSSTVDESKTNREEYHTVFSQEQHPFSLL